MPTYDLTYYLLNPVSDSGSLTWQASQEADSMDEVMAPFTSGRPFTNAVIGPEGGPQTVVFSHNVAGIRIAERQ